MMSYNAPEASSYDLRLNIHSFIPETLTKHLLRRWYWGGWGDPEMSKACLSLKCFPVQWQRRGKDSSGNTGPERGEVDTQPHVCDTSFPHTHVHSRRSLSTTENLRLY